MDIRTLRTDVQGAINKATRMVWELRLQDRNTCSIENDLKDLQEIRSELDGFDDDGDDDVGGTGLCNCIFSDAECSCSCEDNDDIICRTKNEALYEVLKTWRQND